MSEMAFHIKICGLSDAQTTDAAITAGATMIGLVFHEASPRHVDVNQALGVATAVDGRAGLVGLFVNATPPMLNAVMGPVPLTHIQLHGIESPQDLQAIRRDFGRPVLKAGGIAEPGNVRAAEQVFGNGIADMLVFDAKPPADADRPGGHGVPFDWSLLSEASGETPWLLSGGLTPDNVGAAIDAVKDLPGFAGVDVSSGVESAPGLKDASLIAEFVAAARAALEGTSAPTGPAEGVTLKYR